MTILNQSESRESANIKLIPLKNLSTGEVVERLGQVVVIRKPDGAEVFTLAQPFHDTGLIPAVPDPVTEAVSFTVVQEGRSYVPAAVPTNTAREESPAAVRAGSHALATQVAALR